MSLVLVFSGCTNSSTNNDASGLQYSEIEIEISKDIDIVSKKGKGATIVCTFVEKD